MSARIYADDPSIRDDERLFRRVHIKQIVKDDDTGLARVSSGAFRDKELSVNIESTLLAAGGDVKRCLENHQKHKLVAIRAWVCRRFQQAVLHDVLPQDPSHGLVYGNKNSAQVRSGLRDSAKWVLPEQAPVYEDLAKEKIVGES